MIDLHMHSQASDGSDSIPELYQNLIRAGITTFALTDHDTIDGVAEMERLCAADPGRTFFRGIEFSCVSPVKTCHILGYDYDPENPGFLAMIRKGEELRRENLEYRLKFLKRERGIQFSEEAIARFRSMKTVGRPHLAQEIVRMGLAENVADAFHRVMKGISRGGADRLPADEAIHAILAAGGIPVWAHPLGGEGETRLSSGEMDRQLEYLRGCGIRGLECYYSRYTVAEHDMLKEKAAACGLLVSGGSDYHGTAKTIALGELCAEPFAVKEEDLTLAHVLRTRH